MASLKHLIVAQLVWAGLVIFTRHIVAVRQCPCESVAFCQPVHYDMKEVYGVLMRSDEKVWNTFNWTKLTTVSLVDFYDDQLLCLAHKNKVRVITQENFTLQILNNQTYINDWIEQKVSFAQNNFFDGISLFIDDPIEQGSALVEKLTQFVQLVTSTFHSKLNGSLVTFSVPYSPYNEKKTGTDGKNYDYGTIAHTVDHLLVMDFDQRRQSFDARCKAGPSANYYTTIGGLAAYERMNVPRHKLVLVLAYLAFDYECEHYGDNLQCYLPSIPFRQANCSSQVATIVPINQMVNDSRYSDMSRNQFWDEHSATVVFSYISMPYGFIRQVWFDRNDTLELKYRYAQEIALRGVGMWTLNFIPPSADAWQYIPDLRFQPL